VQQVEVWRVRAPLNREELEQRLRELGYAPRRPKTAFRTSARPTDVIVLLWALDHLAPDVALDLVRSVATWAGGVLRRRHQRSRGTVRLLYGPRNEVLAEVEVPTAPAARAKHWL
jgi:hypothetical protein